MTRTPIPAAGAIAMCLLAPAASAQTPARSQAPTLSAMSHAFESLVTSVQPSVVQVVTTRLAPVRTDAGAPESLLPTERTGGSGVVVDSSGLIVTSAHVIEAARTIHVVLAAGPSDGAPGASIVRSRGARIAASVVGVDLETDLAVLRVERDGLPALPFADSDSLKPGQLVFAFGSPFGLEDSVSMGIVSAVGRQREPDDPMVYVQTDAPINPGNSGGPLVDVEGRLVGINTFILSRSGGDEGLGFAAPSNIVRHVFEQIRTWGRVRRGTVGVHAQTITPALAAALNLPQTWGVIVSDVYPGGPAAAAGLGVGDIILSLDGKVMENGRQFDVNVYQRAAGDFVTLEVLRQGTPVGVAVSVVERERDPGRLADLVSYENLVIELGILALDVGPETADFTPPLRTAGGVIVAARTDGSAAALAGLRPGDVIVGVNGKPTPDLAAFRRSLAALGPRGAFALQIQRGLQLRFVAFEMP